MVTDNSRFAARSGSHPLHLLLAAFPIAYFAGALVTDIAYLRTDSGQWETFSIWLLTAGLVTAGLAILAGLIDAVANARTQSRRAVWVHVLGTGVAVLLALVNAFVHSRDGYTAVAPTGVILSALVVVILLFTGWVGGAMVNRDRAGALR